MNNLQLENQWLRDKSDDAYGAYLLISAWNLLEKAWFKKCAQKRDFLDKNLWHIVLNCTRWSRWLATHQSQSFQNTPSLEYKVVEQLPTWPILCHQYTTRAVSLTKCRFNLPSPKLPSSGLMEFYVSQMVCVCIYSLYKIVHYTCNVEYTTRCVVLPSDSSRPLLGHKTRLTTCTVHTDPPLWRACWQCSLPPL